MKFYLTYQGNLKSSNSKGIAKHKHGIRRYFHPQMRMLWQQEPLSMIPESSIKTIKEEGLIKECENFKFQPLVCKQLYLVAELQIVMLRPGIFTQTSDIDNRLKTLFDALSIPQKNQIPQGQCPQDDEAPLYCLLGDDNRITSVSVTYGQLLKKPDVDARTYVELLIHVKTSPTYTNVWNSPLIG